MHPRDIICFSAYALSGLVLPFSSFFFMLLEHYGLQFQHLLLHSIVLVVIFGHLYEMYVCVLLLARLFSRFHVLHFARRSPTHIDGYYFQHRAKGPSKYIVALSPTKWDHWREDWVITHGDAHDRLELSSAVPTTHRSDWERDPNLQLAYNPVLGRI
jgi:hypothetical protein